MDVSIAKNSTDIISLWTLAIRINLDLFDYTQNASFKLNFLMHKAISKLCVTKIDANLPNSVLLYYCVRAPHANYNGPSISENSLSTLSHKANSSLNLCH